MSDAVLPFSWVGSKARMAPWLADHFPRHQVYLEPFAGTASVLLRKERSPIEAINDINSALINFFTVLRDREEELVRAVMLTPYSEIEYKNAVDDPQLDSLERARRFFIRSNSTFGGNQGGGWAASYRLAMNNERGGKYVRAVSGLHRIADRLAGVQIHHTKASVVMARYDAPDCLMYVDPPYIGETRSGSTYEHDLTSLYAHEALLKWLDEAQSSVLLSGYDHELYRDILQPPKWHVIRKDVNANASQRQGATGRRTELVWTNVDPARILLRDEYEEDEPPH